MDRVEKFVVAIIVVMLVLLGMMIYEEIKYPCVKYSDEVTWVLVGKITVPTHACVKRKGLP